MIKAHCRFAGDGWVIYDSSYCPQAANMKSLDWGLMDGHLWNKLFTRRAKAIACCRICFSELHSQVDCPEAPDAHFASAHTKLGCKDPRGRPANCLIAVEVTDVCFSCASMPMSALKGTHSFTAERIIPTLLKEIITDNDRGF